jgi:predicted transcriptional regulator
MSKLEVLDWIKKAQSPVGVADVVKASNLDKEVVQKAFDQLKKEELIVSPIRCKYVVK